MQITVFAGRHTAVSPFRLSLPQATQSLSLHSASSIQTSAFSAFMSRDGAVSVRNSRLLREERSIVHTVSPLTVTLASSLPSEREIIGKAIIAAMITQAIMMMSAFLINAWREKSAFKGIFLLENGDFIPNAVGADYFFVFGDENCFTAELFRKSNAVLNAENEAGGGKSIAE